MDSAELLERFKGLRKKFVKNFEEKSYCERDRNEVARQKKVSVREKWLMKIDDGSNTSKEDKELAAALIQETIDLCNEHLKGLDVDLARLEDEKIELLKEQEYLKQNLPSQDEQTTSENRKAEISEIQKKMRNKTGDKSRLTATSSKIGRKYELQRKIDLELQKLYEKMEADGTLVRAEDEELVQDITSGDDIDAASPKESHDSVHDHSSSSSSSSSSASSEDELADDKQNNNDDRVNQAKEMNQNELNFEHHNMNNQAHVEQDIDENKNSDILEGEVNMEESQAQQEEVEKDDVLRSSPVIVVTGEDGEQLHANIQEHQETEQNDNQENRIAVSEEEIKQDTESLDEVENTQENITLITQENDSTINEQKRATDNITQINDSSSSSSSDSDIEEPSTKSKTNEVADLPTEEEINQPILVLNSELNSPNEDQNLASVSENIVNESKKEAFEEIKTCVAETIHKDINSSKEYIDTSQGVVTETDTTEESDKAPNEVDINIIAAKSLEVTLEEANDAANGVNKEKNMQTAEDLTDEISSDEFVEDNIESELDEFVESAACVPAHDATMQDHPSDQSDEARKKGENLKDSYFKETTPETELVSEMDTTEAIQIDDFNKQEMHQDSKEVSGSEEKMLTFEDIKDDMKNRSGSSNQSTPSYQNLVGDVDEEVKNIEEGEILEQNKEEEARENSSSSSSSGSSSSSESEEFSGNDVDFDLPEEYSDTCQENISTKESAVSFEAIVVVTDEAPEIVPYHEAEEDIATSQHDIETRRLASEIVDEALTSAVAYIDESSRKMEIKNLEENESDLKQASDNNQQLADVRSSNADIGGNNEHESEVVLIETAAEVESERNIGLEKGKDGDLISVESTHEQTEDTDTVNERNTCELTSVADIPVVEQTTKPKEDEIVNETREEEPESTSEENIENIESEMKEKTDQSAPRPAYNPALSQRNTEAEKWFGQPSAEDKIWMKPKGKLDATAELERRKLIKSMTRRHNPKIIAKWQPPEEKNWEDNLEGQQKQSLEKYNQRRQNRISLSSETPIVQETTFPAHSHPQDKEAEEDLSQQEPTKEVEENRPVSEDIVEESVVHSKDAINRWNHILQEKSEKEEKERMRLSVGKQRTAPRPYEIHRQRKDSESSVSSTTSSNAPPSEMIVRESMNISQIRNRWKNMEVDSKTNFRNEGNGANRTNLFTVKTGHMFRPYMTVNPSPVKNNPAPINKVNKRSSKVIPGESFIDREIREAAEREEEYKREAELEKAAEAQKLAAAKQLKTPEPKPQSATPVVEKNVVASERTIVQVDSRIQQTIEEDAQREIEWQQEQLQRKTPQKQESPVADTKTIVPQPRSHANEADEESLSSYCSSGASNDVPLSPTLRQRYQKPVKYSTSSSDHQQDAIDSGIECNNHATLSSPEPKKIVPVIEEPPAVKVLTRKATASEFQDILLKSLIEKNEQETVKEIKAPVVEQTPAPVAVSTIQTSPPKKSQAKDSRARLPSLHNVVTPKGWGQTNSAVSPVSPGHKKVFPPNFQVKKVNGVSPPSSSTPITTQHNTNDNNSSVRSRKRVDDLYDDNHWDGALRKTVDTSQARGGPVFQIIPGKSSLQSAMQQEMEEAKKREEEWTRMQQEEEEERLKKEVNGNQDENDSIIAHNYNNNHIDVDNLKKKTVEADKPPNKLRNYKISMNKIQSIKVEPKVPYIRERTVSQPVITKTSTKYHLPKTKVEELAPKQPPQRRVITRSLTISPGGPSFKNRQTVMKAVRVQRQRSDLAARWETGYFVNRRRKPSDSDYSD